MKNYFPSFVQKLLSFIFIDLNNGFKKKNYRQEHLTFNGHKARMFIDFFGRENFDYDDRLSCWVGQLLKLLWKETF